MATRRFFESNSYAQILALIESKGFVGTVQVFPESGTYSKPAGLKAVTVILFGGGGGGGSGRSGSVGHQGGGNGGAGGGRTVGTFRAEQLQATEQLLQALREGRLADVDPEQLARLRRAVNRGNEKRSE